MLFAATVARKFSIGDSYIKLTTGYRNANCSLSIRFHPHNRSSNLSVIVHGVPLLQGICGQSTGHDSLPSLLIQSFQPSRLPINLAT